MNSELFGKKVKSIESRMEFKLLDFINSQRGTLAIVVDDKGRMLSLPIASLKLDINSIPELTK